MPPRAVSGPRPRPDRGAGEARPAGTVRRRPAPSRPGRRRAGAACVERGGGRGVGRPEGATMKAKASSAPPSASGRKSASQSCGMRGPLGAGAAADLRARPAEAALPSGRGAWVPRAPRLQQLVSVLLLLQLFSGAASPSSRLGAATGPAGRPARRAPASAPSTAGGGDRDPPRPASRAVWPAPMAPCRSRPQA